MRDNRFTIGAVTGDEAVYVSLDPNTAFREVGNKSDYVLSSKEVKLNKVLDLRDPEVLTSLGINKRDLLLDRSETGGAYDMTQIIGNIANKYGFDGIIAPSQPNIENSGINLIIFERGLSQ